MLQSFEILQSEMNCFSTLPTNLCLKPSDLRKGDYEVWSEESIPIGTRFGPYEGMFIGRTKNEKGDFHWQVEKKEKKIMNDCNDRESNWLQFVSYTSNKELQNMIPFKHKSNVYYLTSKSIAANTELLILFQDEIIEDTSQSKGYSRNYSQKAENTEVNTLEISQNSRNHKEKCTFAREENRYITSKTEILHKNLLNNIRIANTSNLDMKQTSFIHNNFYISCIKKENIFAPKEQCNKKKYDSQKYGRIDYINKRKLNLSVSKDTSENPYESYVCRKKYRKCIKLKSQEINCTGGNYYKQDLEKNKLTCGKRLELEKTHTVAHTYISIRSERKCILGSELNTHNWNDTTEKPYDCDILQKKFTGSICLKRCKRIYASEKPYECNTCEKKYSTKTGLIMHERIHTGEKPYACNICEKKFNNRNHLIVHERIHTGEKPYECSICEKKFNNRNHLIVHERIHSGEKLYECSVCEKKFNRRSNLIVHERIHSGEKPYQCHICQKKFINNHHLKVHGRTHTGEKPYECNICQKKFTTNYNFKVHERIHTGEKPYECNMCEKKFNNSNSLIVHERVHTGEKPYECNICQKKFFNSRNLKVHERNHTGEKPYECNICQKKFSYSRSLKKHQTFHTGYKPYECNTCEKKFSYRNALIVHESIHTGERPYKCHICQKKFSSKRGLIVHEMTHTGEKPYECHVCQKKFIQKGNLKVHERTHTGEKLYECNICQKKYSQRNALTVHERTHTGEKPYECNTCESNT